MIKIKAGNARQVYILGTAIAKFSNAEIDHFGLKLIVHVLIRGSLSIAFIVPELILTNERLYLCLIQPVYSYYNVIKARALKQIARLSKGQNSNPIFLKAPYKFPWQ